MLMIEKIKDFLLFFMGIVFSSGCCGSRLQGTINSGFTLGYKTYIVEKFATTKI